MLPLDDERRKEYIRAYEDWQKQLTALHRVLLEGERLDPQRLKGLLSREAHAKERYEEARRRLLGLSSDKE